MSASANGTAVTNEMKRTHSLTWSAVRASASDVGGENKVARNEFGDLFLFVRGFDGASLIVN